MLIKKTPAILFIIPAIFYIYTACPTIYVGDSGEMIAAAYSLGIPHPPGYPLYTMLSHLMTYLPLGTIAFRVNLLAALFGALSCSLLFLLLLKLKTYFRETDHTKFFALVSFLLILTLAFSGTYWAQCVQAKGGLYTLNAFLLISLLLLILSRGSIFSLSLLTGAGLANHNTFVPLSILLLFFYYIELRQNNERTPLIKLTKVILYSLLFGAAIYLYIPIRAAVDPAMNWGEPSTFSKLFHHIFRGQYGTVSEHTRSITLFFKQANWFFGKLFAQFTIIPSLFAVLGVFFIYKRKKVLALLLAGIFTFVTFGLIVMSNISLNAINLYMVEVFFIPAYFVLIIFGAFGCLLIAQKTPALIHKTLCIVLLAALCITVNSNFRMVDRSHNFFAYDYGINIFRSMEKNGALLVAGDNTAFSTAYLTIVEKMFPEKVIYDDYGLIFRNNDAQLKKITATDYLERRAYIKKALFVCGKPLYFVLGSNIHRDLYTELKNEYKAIPSGVIYKIIKTGAKPERFDYKNIFFNGLEDALIYKDTLVKNIIAQYYYFQGEQAKFFKETKAAEDFFKLANEYGKDDEQIQSMLSVISQESGNPKDALEKAKIAIEIDSYSPVAWNNYGVALERTGNLKEAVSAYKKAYELDRQELQYLNNFAGANFNAGNTNEALAAYRELENINERAVNYNGLGAALLKAGKVTDAESAYKKGISIKPAFDLFLGLGNFYINTRRPAEALSYYEKARGLNPASERAWYNAGVAYVQLNDLKNTELCFKKSVELNPGFIDGWEGLAKLSYAAGKKEEALKLCEKIIALNPNNAFVTALKKEIAK